MPVAKAREEQLRVIAEYSCRDAILAWSEATSVWLERTGYLRVSRFSNAPTLDWTITKDHKTHRLGVIISERVYAFPNSGGWYDFGYLIGAAMFLGGTWLLLCSTGVNRHLFVRVP